MIFTLNYDFIKFTRQNLRSINSECRKVKLYRKFTGFSNKMKESEFSDEPDSSFLSILLSY